jgi:hypothetical protein
MLLQPVFLFRGEYTNLLLQEQNQFSTSQILYFDEGTSTPKQNEWHASKMEEDLG